MSLLSGTAEGVAPMRVAAFVLPIVLVSGLVITSAAYNQASSPQGLVEGYSGRIELRADTRRAETVLIFDSDTPFPGGSRRVGWVVQHAPGRVPADRSGRARVFLGQGLLAFRADDGVAVAFRFSSIALPSSLRRYPFDEYEVFGIAKFGESTTLAPEKWLALATTGQCGTGGSGSLASPMMEEICQNCTAGGEGSTSCSVTGCSVSCGAGYYACCNPTGPQCRCCKS